MVSALAFTATGHGFDPRNRRKNILVTEHAFLSSLVSIAGMTLDKCAVLRIGTLTGGPLCRESHPMCRLKNHTVALILQNLCVQYACLLSSRVPSDRDIYWTPLPPPSPTPCRESHPLCRLKNPTVVNMITCRLAFCITGVYNVRLLIILERGCSSIYRKKEGTR